MTLQLPKKTEEENKIVRMYTQYITCVNPATGERWIEGFRTFPAGVSDYKFKKKSVKKKPKQLELEKEKIAEECI